METHCFVKSNSHPLMCGVHDVILTPVGFLGTDNLTDNPPGLGRLSRA